MLWQMVEEATTVLDCVPLCIELKTPTVKLLSEMLTEATQQFIKADSDAMCTRTGGTLCHLLELVGYNAGWSSRSGLPLHPAAYDSKDPIIPAVLSLSGSLSAYHSSGFLYLWLCYLAVVLVWHCHLLVVLVLAPIVWPPLIVCLQMNLAIDQLLAAPDLEDRVGGAQVTSKHQVHHDVHRFMQLCTQVYHAVCNVFDIGFKTLYPVWICI